MNINKYAYLHTNFNLSVVASKQKLNNHLLDAQSDAVDHPWLSSSH